MATYKFSARSPKIRLFCRPVYTERNLNTQTTSESVVSLCYVRHDQLLYFTFYCTAGSYPEFVFFYIHLAISSPSFPRDSSHFIYPLRNRSQTTASCLWQSIRPRVSLKFASNFSWKFGSKYFRHVHVFSTWREKPLPQVNSDRSELVYAIRSFLIFFPRSFYQQIDDCVPAITHVRSLQKAWAKWHHLGATELLHVNSLTDIEI